MSFGMVAAAAIGVGGSILASNSQKKAADRATAAQTAASDQQIALQREQNAKAEQLMAPHIARGNSARGMLDARWAGPPDPRAAAYGPQSPGGPYGPMSAASAYGQPQSVYGAQGAPRASVQVGYQSVPKVGVPTRPAPAPTAPAAPRWQSVQASGLPPLPQWNPQAAQPNAAPGAPAAQPSPLANVNSAALANIAPRARSGAGSVRSPDAAERRLVMRY